MLRFRDERVELGHFFTNVVEGLEVGTQRVATFTLFCVKVTRAFRVRLARAFRVRLARALGWWGGRLVVRERHGGRECLVLSRNEVSKRHTRI